MPFYDLLCHSMTLYAILWPSMTLYDPLCHSMKSQKVCAITSDNQLIEFPITSPQSLVTQDLQYAVCPFHGPKSITGMDTCVLKPLLITICKDNTLRVWNFKTHTPDLTKVFLEDMYVNKGYTLRCRGDIGVNIGVGYGVGWAYGWYVCLRLCLTCSSVCLSFGLSARTHTLSVCLAFSRL